MADIFISYSRHDSDQASRLMEDLQTLGRSVWIDSSGIAGGETWTSEIVEGINQCRTFILLISPDSINSHNCAKELHLAVEKGKHILPVVLTQTALSPAFEYPLAGLQRVPMTDMPAIIRSLVRLDAHASLRHDVDEVHEQDNMNEKRLAVLPFEDHSPEHDNGWFADGLTDELITILNKLERVFVTDKQTSREYKGSLLSAKQISHELAVRYIIHGSVMKAGPRIRVSADLVDTHSGLTLWDERFSGTMDDIFEIQESIARQIADGLMIHLTPRDEENLTAKQTENAEAFELALRAREYFTRHTKTDFEYAISLLEQAIQLDPNYANAYLNIGNLYLALYMLYERNPDHLEKAEMMLRQSLHLDPSPVIAHLTFARFLVITSRREAAEEVAKAAESRLSHNPAEFIHMSQYYHFIGDHISTALMIEKALALNPDLGMTAYFNLLSSYYHANNDEMLRKTAERSLPRFRKYLQTHPDDQTQRVHYIWALEFSGNVEDALRQASTALATDMKEGRNLYNLGCVYARLNKYNEALDVLERAVNSGFSFSELINTREFDRLREEPRFQAILKKLDLNIGKGN